MTPAAANKVSRAKSYPRLSWLMIPHAGIATVTMRLLLVTTGLPL